MMAGLKTIVLAAFATMMLFSQAEAAIVNAASCASAAVASAVAAAQDGDSVHIPAGSCTWTTTLKVTKGITIAGAGVGSTIITDAIDRTTYDAAMLDWSTALGQSVRLTGITFKYAASKETQNGSVRFGGTSRAVRIDHNHFDRLNFVAMLINGWIYGVVDHNTFDGFKCNGSMIRTGHHGWNNQKWGDGSWADNPLLGSSQSIFIEDNIFNGKACTNIALTAAQDIKDGGRQVFRFNTVHNSAFQGHAFEGRSRGARLAEVYANTFTFDDPNNIGSPTSLAIFWRTGSLLVWGNESTGYINLVRVVNDRSYRTDVGGVLWGTCGTWNGTPSNWDQNTNSLGYACLDQPGRGKSDLLPQVLNPTPAWPHQALEPMYEWENAYNPTGASQNDAVWSSGSGTIARNRDYVLSTSSFNGTSGVGSGPLASRPTTCTAGVAYWATDQGSWNAGTNPYYDGQGTLYKCTTTNTWTLHYVPYAYPHPLTGSTASSLPAPTNLLVR
jgi:hypothetical protein